MKIQVESFEYESMKKLDTLCIPEIGGTYTVSEDGSIHEKFARIEYDGVQWVWIPHEMSMYFKVPPIRVKIKIFGD